MKYSFSLALTIATCIAGIGTEPVFAQQAEYRLTPQQEAQAAYQQNQFLQAQWAQAQYMQQQQFAQAAYQQQAAAQMAYQQQQQLLAARPVADSSAPAVHSAAVTTQPKAHVPTDYELQEQAIQKGLAENKAVPVHKEDYAPQNYGNDSNYNNVSKVRSAANLTGKVLAKSAAVALPTVGMVLLTRALNRNTVNGGMGMGMNGSGRGLFGGSGYGAGYGNGQASGW